MNEQSSVYIFRHGGFSPSGDTNVCAAPVNLVTAVYGVGGLKGKEGLIAAFGGAAFFRNEETGSSYLGVWGARNASRFRSALRVHAAINLVHAAPPARFVWRHTESTRPKPGSSIESEL